MMEEGDYDYSLQHHHRVILYGVMSNILNSA